MELELAKKEEHYKFLYNTRKNPKIDSMLSGEPPKDYSQHLRYVSSVQENSRWIFLARDEDTLIGYSQIYDIRENQLEVGFAIDPNHQGKGYGKELVLKTIAKAKELFPNKSIILYVLKKNKKAIHIYSKIGFVEKYLESSDDETLGMILK